MGKSLVSLRIFCLTANVKNLSSIDIGCFKCLQILWIDSCWNLVSLPSDLRKLTSLKKLIVSRCSKLVTFEDDEDQNEGEKINVVNNFSLEVFVIGRLPKVTALPNWLTRYARNSLRTLYIKHMNELESLRHLYLIHCNPKLEAEYREGPERTKLPLDTYIQCCDKKKPKYMV